MARLQMDPKVKTARITGLLYLALAISGVIGFLVIRSRIYVPEDAVATFENLRAQLPLARLGAAADLTIVVAQALAAVWFYKLFRDHNRLAAGALAGFGLVNSVILMVATIFSSAAILVVADGSLAAAGDQQAVVQLLYQLNDSAWDVGAIFFGLWLIPMGYIVWTEQVMPRALGMTLMIGGMGYVASAYVSQLLPESTVLFEALSYPASVGEFWMIGYLLFVGIRRAGTPSLDREAVPVLS